MDDGNPTKQLTKQHQVLIVPVENEIDKITEGSIPEFRDSFVRWGAVVLCATNEASRNWLRETLPRLVPWEWAKLRMAAMRVLKKPKRASFHLPGKYEYQRIVAKLQRRSPDLGVEGVCVHGQKNRARFLHQFLRVFSRFFQYVVLGAHLQNPFF